MKRQSLIDLFILSALAMAAWKLTHHLGGVLDLPTDDDAIYLNRALKWKRGEASLDAAWGPLYSIVYAWMSGAWGTVSAFYTFSRLLIGALPLVTYVVSRRFTSPLFAGVAGFFLVIAEANWEAFPKVNHLATILVLGFYALSFLFSDKLVAFAIAGIGFTLAAFVRPEYALPTLILAGLFGFLIVQKWRGGNLEWPRFKWVTASGALWALISFGCLFAWGFPFSEGRTWQAFSEHFLVINGAHFSSDDPSWSHYLVRMKVLFPKAHCFSQMLWFYPGEVFKHFFMNLFATPKTLARSLLSHAPMLLPAHLPYGKTLEAFALGLGVMAGALTNRQATFSFFEHAKKKLGDYSLWPLLVLPLPGFMASVFTLPYVRHFTSVTILFWIALVVLFERWAKTCHSLFLLPAGSAVLALPVFIVAATPVLNSTWMKGPVPRVFFNREMVARIQNLPFKPENRPLVIFAIRPKGVAAFLGAGYKTWSTLDRPFTVLLRQVDIIIPDSPVEELGPYRNSKEYSDFRKDPGAYGFVTFQGAGQLPFWVRKDRLVQNLTQSVGHIFN